MPEKPLKAALSRADFTLFTLRQFVAFYAHKNVDRFNFMRIITTKPNDTAKQNRSSREGAMWNVTCYSESQDGIKSRIDDGTARVLETAYRAVLERYSQVAVLAQQDQTAGLDEGVSHFEQGLSAWAFICAEAYEAAMNSIAYSLLAQFDAVWIDE